MKRFIEEGDKVKVTLRFRGRELAHPELGMKLLQRVRADFEPIAREVLVVAAPGPAKADPTMFSWSRLRPGLRLKPKGPAFKPSTSAG